MGPIDSTDFWRREKSVATIGTGTPDRPTGSICATLTTNFYRHCLISEHSASSQVQINGVILF